MIASCLVALLCLAIAIAGELMLRYQRGKALDRQILAIQEQLDKDHPTENSAFQTGLLERVVRSNARYGAQQYVEGLAGPYVYRPYIGYRETPSLGANSLGYRGPEFEISKPAGVFRILVYGGSFVWGVGVDEDATIPARLQQVLAAENNGSLAIEVINCGEANFCTTQELVFLAIEGVLLSPDLVIFVDGVNDTAWGNSNLPAGYHGMFHHHNSLLRSEPLKTLYTVHELDHLTRERDRLSQSGDLLIIRRLQRILHRHGGEALIHYNEDHGGLDYSPKTP